MDMRRDELPECLSEAGRKFQAAPSTAMDELLDHHLMAWRIGREPIATGRN
jgi:hypothetical protein